MELTIVIPYFKRRFLREALASLAAQTCKDFVVLIGDDCSPEDPAGIVEAFGDRLRVTYHRFPANLGGKSVVSHWNRCIALTRTKWVWLFSDDDVVSPECVDAFQREIQRDRTPVDVYRFDSSIINSDGEVMRESPVNPAEESAADLGLCRLLGWREFFIQNHIFSRGSFDREGGLVDLPTGLFSEDASYARLARTTGIRTIQGGRVFWRESGGNLNAPRPELVGLKLSAAMKHFSFIRTLFKSEDRDFHRALRAGAARWIMASAGNLGGSPGFWPRLKFYLKFAGFAPTKAVQVVRSTAGTWRNQRLGDVKERAIPG